jgi:phytanoyl-CoA hydroxylase
VFRGVTLENERLRQLVRDLRFHRDPVGKAAKLYIMPVRGSDFLKALQSMIIMKQPEIGGAGE